MDIGSERKVALCTSKTVSAKAIKHANMQVTDRDVAILSWINRFGYVHVGHVAKRYQMSYKTAYRRLGKLVRHGYLKHQRFLYGKYGVYFLTTTGQAISGQRLSCIRKISIATLQHQLLVVSLSLILEQKLAGQFITERELRQALGQKGVGVLGHISDGVLQCGDKKIAIEVELTPKGKYRLDKIFSHYVKATQYHEVWYFCRNERLLKLLKPFADKAHFIKLYLLADYVKLH